QRVVVAAGDLGAVLRSGTHVERGIELRHEPQPEAGRSVEPDDVPLLGPLFASAAAVIVEAAPGHRGAAKDAARNELDGILVSPFRGRRSSAAQRDGLVQHHLAARAIDELVLDPYRARADRPTVAAGGDDHALADRADRKS